MNNRVIIGAGTSVPLSNIDKNGTKVPAPENEKNYGTKISIPRSVKRIGLHLKVYTSIKYLPPKVRLKSDLLGANE